MSAYTCETCGASAGASGVACGACQSARLDTLLGSDAWRSSASQRSGDQPGETMLDTILRERWGMAR